MSKSIDDERKKTRQAVDYASTVDWKISSDPGMDSKAKSDSEVESKTKSDSPEVNSKPKADPEQDAEPRKVAGAMGDEPNPGPRRSKRPVRLPDIVVPPRDLRGLDAIYNRGSAIGKIALTPEYRSGGMDNRMHAIIPREHTGDIDHRILKNPPNSPTISDDQRRGTLEVQDTLLNLQQAVGRMPAKLKSGAEDFEGSKLEILPSASYDVKDEVRATEPVHTPSRRTKLTPAELEQEMKDINETERVLEMKLQQSRSLAMECESLLNKLKGRKRANFEDLLEHIRERAGPELTEFARNSKKRALQ